MTDKFHHWTTKQSFNLIMQSKRILGLTEGRVYLSKGEKRSWSISGEKSDYKIVFDNPVAPNFAKRHPILFPPSWWGITKFDQWVTPLGKNIIWTHATLNSTGDTLTVHDAVLETQKREHLIYGYTRFFLRWLFIDLLPVWALVFAWHVTKDTEQSPICSVINLMSFLVILFMAWYFLQRYFNKRVADSYITP